MLSNEILHIALHFIPGDENGIFEVSLGDNFEEISDLCSDLNKLQSFKSYKVRLGINNSIPADIESPYKITLNSEDSRGKYNCKKKI